MRPARGAEEVEVHSLEPARTWSPVLLLGATLPRQRCAELPHARRGAGSESRPAHSVGVVSLEQSPPLSGAGELEEPAAGFVPSGCRGDGPQHLALPAELRVLGLGGWGKHTKHTITSQSVSKCTQESLSGCAESPASISMCADAL